MANALSTFEPPRGLDDMPQEVLDNIWAQFFNDMTVRYSPPTDSNSILDCTTIVPVMLISKKHTENARRAMLKNATISLGSSSSATLLSCCTDISAIRFLKLRAFGVNQHSFILMDGFFRTLTNLKFLQIELSLQMYGSWRDHASLFENNKEWSENLVQSLLRQRCYAVFRQDENDVNGYWLRDIINGKAFQGSEAPPLVDVVVKTDGHDSDDDDDFDDYHEDDFDESHCRFEIDTATLVLTIDGREIARKQALPKFEIAGSRGGRSLLCDGSAINTVVRDTIESIIGQKLCSWDLAKFCRFESKRDYGLNPASPDLEDEVYLAACHMYKFCMDREPCRKLIKWLESRKVPNLRLETLTQARELFSTALGRALTLWEQQLMEETWNAHPQPISFSNLIPVYQYVASTFLGTDPRSRNGKEVWHICFDALYGCKYENAESLYGYDYD